MSNNLTVTLLYFASLAEQAGIDEEILTTSHYYLNDIYSYLLDKYDFNLTQDELAVAVNHQIANWQTKVSNGDIIAFIPPVAGG
ncbi:MoaD/ThiS family protein [Moraxella catarrhalis]|uniref:MoaD/ThiS family protein n=1 Tax=Moraxella catarrhalis TaxID=480 RepID=UPI000EA91CCA|nr:MoaD/ThiS family protein [Moraxella catarrhalis]MCG6817271.1 MoaD/ThiS family protein [Moraxella catarrhalis]MPW57799.1 MoaD/ThiS family protein [Moraxella catarrhalis]MPW59801.1 MoaD/ThiS family protein [Moraxella catarrhalis]RKM32860.1 MoaD/ThiS family protein [Moraxella catarrhalis]